MTTARVINTFEDALGDPNLAKLPSESNRVVLDVRYGFVVERGAVVKVTTGIVFAVSGGCCLDTAKKYSVRQYLGREDVDVVSLSRYNFPS